MCHVATCIAVTVLEIESSSSKNLDATMHARSIKQIPLSDSGDLLPMEEAYVCVASRNNLCPRASRSYDAERDDGRTYSYTDGFTLIFADGGESEAALTLAEGETTYDAHFHLHFVDEPGDAARATLQLVELDAGDEAAQLIALCGAYNAGCELRQTWDQSGVQALLEAAKYTRELPDGHTGAVDPSIYLNFVTDEASASRGARATVMLNQPLPMELPPNVQLVIEQRGPGLTFTTRPPLTLFAMACAEVDKLMLIGVDGPALQNFLEQWGEASEELNPLYISALSGDAKLQVESFPAHKHAPLLYARVEPARFHTGHGAIKAVLKNAPKQCYAYRLAGLGHMEQCAAAFRRVGVSCGASVHGHSAWCPPFPDIKQLHGENANRGHDRGIPALKPHMTPAQHEAYLVLSDAVHFGSLLDRMMGFEAQLYLFGGALNDPIPGLPAKPDARVPTGFQNVDNSPRLKVLRENMLQASDEIIFQLHACSIEGRPGFWLNCPVTPSFHMQGHVWDLTLESVHTNCATEEVDETRNGPARKCSNRFAQGSQVGANRRILLCMRRSDQRAWANGGHARMQQAYAERSLRKHHTAGKELAGFLECTFNMRWPACLAGKPYTFEWRPPRGGKPGTCARHEKPCSFARVMGETYLTEGELTVKLTKFAASNEGRLAEREARRRRRHQKAARGGDGGAEGGADAVEEEETADAEDEGDHEEFHGEDEPLGQDDEWFEDETEDEDDDTDEGDDDEDEDGDDEEVDEA